MRLLILFIDRQNNQPTKRQHFTRGTVCLDYLPNLVCIFLVTLVGNQQRRKAHESGVEDVDGNVEIQNEVTRSLGPRPNNRWSPVKQLRKQNAAPLEVTLKHNIV